MASEGKTKRRYTRKPGLRAGPYFPTAESWCTCESCTAGTTVTVKRGLAATYSMHFTTNTNQESKTNV